MQSQLPFGREGKFILPKHFAYDNVLDSESEVEDQVEYIFGIEDEVQLDPDLVPTPNPSPKWAQKVIEAAKNMTRESSDKRRTISQFQNEILVLCQANPLLLEKCYKLPKRCYMMVRSGQWFSH